MLAGGYNLTSSCFQSEGIQFQFSHWALPKDWKPDQQQTLPLARVSDMRLIL